MSPVLALLASQAQLEEQAPEELPGMLMHCLWRLIRLLVAVASFLHEFLMHWMRQGEYFDLLKPHANAEMEAMGSWAQAKSTVITSSMRCSMRCSMRL